jgi:hypothetical protein
LKTLDPALTLLLSGCGGATSKVYRVGSLSGLDYFANTADSFKAKMAELGYVEGKNIVHDLQNALSRRSMIDTSNGARISRN